MAREYETFEEFYPFYISQHQDDTCRRLHVIGTSLTLAVLVYILLNRAWSRMWVLPIVGYGFAWVGHFFFEKNKPATFQYPLFSFMGDFRMLYEVYTGARAF